MVHGGEALRIPGLESRDERLRHDVRSGPSLAGDGDHGAVGGRGRRLRPASQLVLGALEEALHSGDGLHRCHPFLDHGQPITSANRSTVVTSTSSSYRNDRSLHLGRPLVNVPVAGGRPAHAERLHLASRSTWGGHYPARRPLAARGAGD